MKPEVTTTLRFMRRRERGFSVVEVMIAATLSLIVLAGVLAVMFSSRVTYNENERVARLQESGRAAIDLLMRDLRGAGFPGCAQPIDGLVNFTNTLTLPTALMNNYAEPVYGYEGSSGSWTPVPSSALFPNASPGNDILVVRTIPSHAPAMRVTTQVDTADTTFTVTKDAGETLPANRPALISDCGNAAVFRVASFTADGADTGATITRPSSGILGADFRVGARIMPLATVGYFIAPSSIGTGNSLWQVTDATAAREMVLGVDALEVRYGVSNGSNVVVQQYVNANAVADWSRVISVSIAILIRSADASSPIVDSRTYSLLGVNRGPFNDRFQRSVFTTTITLRNETT